MMNRILPPPLSIVLNKINTLSNLSVGVSGKTKKKKEKTLASDKQHRTSDGQKCWSILMASKLHCCQRIQSENVKIKSAVKNKL